MFEIENTLNLINNYNGNLKKTIILFNSIVFIKSVVLKNSIDFNNRRQMKMNYKVKVLITFYSTFNSLSIYT